MSKDKLIYTIAIMMFTIIESGCTDYQNIEGTVYGDKYKACIDSINDNHFDNYSGFRWDGKTATCVCNNVNCDADKVCNQVGQCDSIDCVSDQCDGDNLIKCVHGKEQKVECKAGCDSSEIRCRECNDGDKRCKNSTTKEVCKNYHWEEEKCPTDAQYCIPDHFYGYSDLCDSRCVPGSDFCMNGSVYICDQDGKFPEEGQPCENGGKAVSCNASGKCGECLNEETQCRSGNHYYLCIDGKFQETGNCTYCTEGEVLSCIENGNTTILRKCDSNGKVIDDTENCKTGCNESRKDCKENTPAPVKCVTNNDCADGQTCDQSTGQCMNKADNVCIDNAYKCNGKFLSQCEDNKWKEIRECPNGCENNSCKCPDSCKDNCDENYECIEEACPDRIRYVCPPANPTTCTPPCCKVVHCDQDIRCSENEGVFNDDEAAKNAFCTSSTSDVCQGNLFNTILCTKDNQICVGRKQISIPIKIKNCSGLKDILMGAIDANDKDIQPITNEMNRDWCYSTSFDDNLFIKLVDEKLCMAKDSKCSTCNEECESMTFKCDGTDGEKECTEPCCKLVNCADGYTCNDQVLTGSINTLDEATEKFCQNSSPQPAECTNGTFKCINSKIVECMNGQYSGNPEPCTVGYTCIDNTVAPPASTLDLAKIALCTFPSCPTGINDNYYYCIDKKPLQCSDEDLIDSDKAVYTCTATKTTITLLRCGSDEKISIPKPDNAKEFNCTNLQSTSFPCPIRHSFAIHKTSMTFDSCKLPSSADNTNSYRCYPHPLTPANCDMEESG